MKLSIEGREFQVEVAPGQVKVDGHPLKVEIKEASGAQTALQVEGRPHQVEVKERTGAEVVVVVDGRTYRVAVEGLRAARPAPPAAARVEEKEGAVCKSPLLDGVTAVMPGRILVVKVKEGEQVKAGTVLCILEAMKMQNEIRAPKDGVVSNIQVSDGASVNGGDLLMQVC